MKKPVPELAGTTWEKKWDDGCADSMIFNADGTHVFFGCELMEESKGSWLVQSDTLYLTEHEPRCDDHGDHIADPGLIPRWVRYALVYNGKALQYIARFEKKAKQWRNTEHVFDKNYDFYPAEKQVAGAPLHPRYGDGQHPSVFQDAVPEVRSAATSEGVFIFKGAGFAGVVLEKDKSDPTQMFFSVEAGKDLWKGKAQLVLLEEDGAHYLPEGTPILDVQTGKEYLCDSTYSFTNGKMSFVFAMENGNAKRLSFIVHNSSDESLREGFYTLYRKE